MPHQHPQLAYDRITERESLRPTMDQKTVETILNYFMAKLPEADLRELDNLLAEQGSSLDTPPPARASTPAMDAALGDADRQRFLRLGPKARNAIRSARTASIRGYRGVAQDSAPAKGAISIRDETQFPHAARLRVY